MPLALRLSEGLDTATTRTKRLDAARTRQRNNGQSTNTTWPLSSGNCNLRNAFAGAKEPWSVPVFPREIAQSVFRVSQCLSSVHGHSSNAER